MGVKEGVTVLVLVGVRVGVRVTVGEGVNVLVAGLRVFVALGKAD